MYSSVTKKTTPVASWADAWLDALTSFSHPGRMRRGRQFATLSRIRRLDIKPGQVRAKVKDGNHTYDVDIRLTPFDDATWDRITKELASQALYSARLLAGEIPPEVVEVFDEVGAPLFPRTDVLQASCTCPDWEVPCKHIAGVYYLLAEAFEEDPFQLFLLRGRSKEEFLTALRQYRQVATEIEAADSSEDFESPPLEETLSHFYDIGPSMEDVRFNINPPPTSLPHLKRLGPPPFTNVDLVTLLSPVYEIVTETALDWAYRKPGRSS